eukprot:sb/3479408/
MSLLQISLFLTAAFVNVITGCYNCKEIVEYNGVLVSELGIPKAKSVQSAVDTKILKIAYWCNSDHAGEIVCDSDDGKSCAKFTLRVSEKNNTTNAVSSGKRTKYSTVLSGPLTMVWRTCYKEIYSCKLIENNVHERLTVDSCGWKIVKRVLRWSELSVELQGA